MSCTIVRHRPRPLTVLVASLILLTSCGDGGTPAGPTPTCESTPSRLDFGSVQLGSTRELSFTIRNGTSETLTGSVAESCAVFSIESGAGDFALEAGRERTVTVRFAPSSPGLQTCTVGLGATGCGAIGCSGTGTVEASTTGSCCAPAGTCTVTMQADCSGAWSAGGVCLPNPCATPPGMVLLPAGTFTMGSPLNEPGRYDDEIQHQVTLTNPIYVSIHEVTQAEWFSVMNWNESSYPGAARPVEQVTWYDAVSYCNLRSAREGFAPVYAIAGVRFSGSHIINATVTWNRDANGYRLLTEAEWEYACRAGSTTAFCNGGVTNSVCFPVDPKLDEVGWYCGNAEMRTHDVGGKAANAWGLQDMHGNVWEWCWDWYGEYPGVPVSDPIGPSSGSYRVVRGGAWSYGALTCRSAFRNSNFQIYRYVGIGLRVARTAG